MKVQLKCHCRRPPQRASEKAVTVTETRQALWPLGEEHSHYHFNSPNPKPLNLFWHFWLPTCIANSKQPMGLGVWSNPAQYTRLKNRSGEINQESTVRLT